MPRKLLSFDPVELRRLYVAENMTTSEVAARFGCNAQSISNHLKKHGIPRKPQVGRADRQHPNKARKMESNGFWKGGRVVDRNGYVCVKFPDHPNATRSGYVREHRLVMEKMLGRYLTGDEVVHHRDGNTSNNAPSNLELFARNSDHLGSTLKGKCPRWTPEGREQMRQANLRKSLAAEASQRALETYARSTRGCSAETLLKLLSPNARALLRMALMRGESPALESLETIRGRPLLSLRDLKLEWMNRRSGRKAE